MHWVHAVAFAPPEALHNDFLLTTREAFRIAHDVSVYSLIALSRAAEPLMTEGGAITTLTYYGSQKVGAALQRDGCRGKLRSKRPCATLPPTWERRTFA